MSKLIEAIPTNISEIQGGGYFITFREIVIWHPFTAVILTPVSPRCAILMMTLDETGMPQCSVEKERALTPEERAHFMKLAKEKERETKRQQHRQQRQQVELAKPTVLNNKTLM